MQYILKTDRNVTVAVTQLQTFIFCHSFFKGVRSTVFFFAFSHIWLFLSFSTINPQQFMSPQTLWTSKNRILYSAALIHQFVIIKPQFVVFFVRFFLVFFNYCYNYLFYNVYWSVIHHGAIMWLLVEYIIKGTGAVHFLLYCEAIGVFLT